MAGRRVLLVLGLYGAIVLGALFLGLSPGSLVVLVVSGAVSTWRNRRSREKQSAFWAIVWRLRQAGVEERSRLLAALEPTLRLKIEQILREDGTNQAIGDREQFPFPRGLTRLVSHAYWVIWSIAIGALVLAAVTTAPLFYRVLAVLAAAICAYGAWLASQRETLYRSIIEVTPFRISELLPDGRVYTISWNTYLELHHEPKKSRFRVVAPSQEPGIALDFRRMGFERLIALVVEYGGFQSDTNSPAS